MRRRLLILAVWLLGVAGLWWLVPLSVSPRASFVVPGRLAGVSDAGVVVAFGDTPVGAADSGIGPVTAWDVASGRLLWSAHGPADRVRAELTEDGRRVVVRVGDLVDWTELRDIATGAVVARLPGWVDFSPPDGRWALSDDDTPHGGHDWFRAYDLWESATGRWVRRLENAQYWFSPDGRRLLGWSQNPDGWTVYDAETGRLIARPELSRMAWWMSDGRLIREDGLVWDVDAHAATGRFSDVAGWGRMDSFPHPDGPWRIDFDRSPAETGPPPAVLSWRLADGRWRWATPPRRHQLINWRVTADGRAVVMISGRERTSRSIGQWITDQHPALYRFGPDDTFTILDADTAAVLAHLPPCDVLRLSADGRTLLTESFADDAGRTRVEAWDVPQRRDRRLFAVLAAGWAVVLAVGYRWLGRKRRTVVAAIP